MDNDKNGGPSAHHYDCVMSMGARLPLAPDIPTRMDIVMAALQEFLKRRFPSADLRNDGVIFMTQGLAISLATPRPNWGEIAEARVRALEEDVTAILAFIS